MNLDKIRTLKTANKAPLCGIFDVHPTSGLCLRFSGTLRGSEWVPANWCSRSPPSRTRQRMPGIPHRKNTLGDNAQAVGRANQSDR